MPNVRPTTPPLAPLRTLVLAALAVCLPGVAFAAPKPAPDHWVGTWATASLDRVNSPSPNAPPPTTPPFGSADTTLRQIVHVSLGGPLVRIELSNEFGTEPLTVGAVHLALAAAKGDISLLSANALTFSGRPSVTLPAGAVVVSDPVALALPANTDLTISLFLPAQTISHLTSHDGAEQTNYMAPGNVVGARSLPASAQTFSHWYFLKSVDVQVPAADASIVALGDSITDGTASTPDTNQRWPDLLARRLHRNKSTAGLGVLNVGIGGNRVLHEGAGPSALARFSTDVLAQPGVRYLIVLESINDIGRATDTSHPSDSVSADDLIAGLTQLAERAHEHNIQVFGATLTPYAGAGYMSPAGEQMRQAVNNFIRTAKVFDGVIDFDRATQDKANPAAFNPAYDRGDHLHPNDAGMKAMADSIDLKFFELNKKEKYDITHQP